MEGPEFEFRQSQEIFFLLNADTGSGTLPLPASFMLLGKECSLAG
jgi:hypothetical protein